MSADNAYFVIKYGDRYSVAHGFMSYDDENSYFSELFNRGKKFSSRSDALVYAHDSIKEEYIVEYGVVEVDL